MSSNEFSRRDFVRSTGLSAAALFSGQAIGLGPDRAKAASEERSALSDYEGFDGLGLAGLVKDGKVSASELLQAAIERVEQRNPTVNAVVDRMYDQAKAAIAAGLPSGPFAGVLPTIRGTSNIVRVAPVAVQPPQSRRVWFPWLMVVTAGDRFVSPLRAAGYSA